MTTPQYIFICDTRDSTGDAIQCILGEAKQKRVLVVTSTSPSREIEWIVDFMDSMGVGLTTAAVERDDTGAVERVVESVEKHGATLCVGVGGGRVLDVAKYASSLSAIPFVSYPTLLSHDGIASPVAVIHDGNHWSESRPAASPFGVIVDLNTVARAPADSILSGISDLTANLFASLDAERFISEPARENDKLAAAISRSASQLVFPGFQGVSVDSLSREQLKHLAWGLVLSGVAMSISGNSRPASGAEHKISHAIDYLFPVRISHGFTVSVGNVVSAFLHERYQSEIISFNISLGLPVTSDDIGIAKRDFTRAVLHAQTVRPGRYTILEKKNLSRDEIERLLEKIDTARDRVAGNG